MANHMATTWGWPVGPIVATLSTRCSARYAATSASVILIRSPAPCHRYITPGAQQLRCHLALWADRRRWQTPVGPDDRRQQGRRCDLTLPRPRVERVIEPFDDRVDHRCRQPSAATGNRPDRRAGQVGDRRQGRRPRGGDETGRIERLRLDQHDVRRSRRDGRCLHRHELALDLVALQPLDERGPLVAGVDGEHAEVPAPHECLGGHRWPAHGRHRHPIRQRRRQRVDRRVVGDLLHRCACRRHRVGVGQQPGTEPPQRSTGRMAFDDPSAGHDETGGIEPQAAEGTCRLPHERLGIGATGPGHVSEALDGVHLGEGTHRCWGPIGGDCYRPGPWRRTLRRA